MSTVFSESPVPSNLDDVFKNETLIIVNHQFYDTKTNFFSFFRMSVNLIDLFRFVICFHLLPHSSDAILSYETSFSFTNE